jgi:hypothetical protein
MPMGSLTFQLEQQEGALIHGLLSGWQSLPQPGEFFAFFTATEGTFYARLNRYKPSKKRPEALALELELVSGKPSLHIMGLQILSAAEFYRQRYGHKTAHLPLYLNGIALDLSQSGSVVYVQPGPNKLIQHIIATLLKQDTPIVVIDPVGMTLPEAFEQCVLGRDKSLSIQDVGANRFIAQVVSGLAKDIQAEAATLLTQLMPATPAFIPLSYFAEHGKLQKHPLGSSILHGLFALHTSKLYASRPEEVLHCKDLSTRSHINLSRVPAEFLPQALAGILQLLQKQGLPAETELIILASELATDEVTQLLQYSGHRTYLVSRLQTPWRQWVEDSWLECDQFGHEGIQIQGRLTRQIPLFFEKAGLTLSQSLAPEPLVLKEPEEPSDWEGDQDFDEVELENGFEAFQFGQTGSNWITETGIEESHATASLTAVPTEDDSIATGLEDDTPAYELSYFMKEPDLRASLPAVAAEDWRHALIDETIGEAAHEGLESESVALNLDSSVTEEAPEVLLPFVVPEEESLSLDFSLQEAETIELPSLEQGSENTAEFEESSWQASAEEVSAHGTVLTTDAPNWLTEDTLSLDPIEALLQPSGQRIEPLDVTLNEQIALEAPPVSEDSQLRSQQLASPLDSGSEVFNLELHELLQDVSLPEDSRVVTHVSTSPEPRSAKKPSYLDFVIDETDALGEEHLEDHHAEDSPVEIESKNQITEPLETGLTEDFFNLSQLDLLEEEPSEQFATFESLGLEAVDHELPREQPTENSTAEFLMEESDTEDFQFNFALENTSEQEAVDRESSIPSVSKAEEELPEKIPEPVAPLAVLEQEVKPVVLYQPGQNVLHPRYGKGVVKKVISMDNAQVILHINFEEIGKRLLDPSLTPLEKVS